MTQGLRPSQYITTFGPGSLIETPTGPYILLGIDDLLSRIHSNSINMEDIAIRDIRLQRGLLEGDRIFKIPDESISENFRYPTRKFPTWNLCVQHQHFNVIHKADVGCPECKTAKEKTESKNNKFAIRFLIACPNGHLDDVNWPWLVHQPKPGINAPVRCNGQHFHWLGSGSSLTSIQIQCPSCKAQRPLGEIYSSKLPCRGRRPERAGGAVSENCTAQAIVVQRGSFQLRLPEVITSLTIPPLVNALHRVLQRQDIIDVCKDLKKLNLFNETAFWTLLDGKIREKRIPESVGEQLKQCSWKDIADSVEQIESTALHQTLSEYLSQEHKSLMDVVETGFPPYPHDNDRRPGEPISFQVNATAIRKGVEGPAKKIRFRIMPLERLRVVMVQVGYRRVNYSGPESVLSSNKGAHALNPQEYWFPGVEQFGEGVYIDIDPAIGTQSSWLPRGDEVKRWEESIPSKLGPNDLVFWNPLSVWWHTFSHRLINAMSIHSGYSSTAIRERVYLSKNESGQFRGGVLLYTTQPGGDGTMGGLTSLVSDFENVFELAMNSIDRCSNDPLCEKADVDIVSKLGAACYSCEMVSETSCEHYNGYLHRGILLENLP